MSVHKSYFSKNNTIQKNSKINTAKNPIAELFYGGGTYKTCLKTGNPADICRGATGYTTNPNNNYSRYIFDLNLSDLKTKYNNKTIMLTAGTGTTHVIRMTNTSYFDKSLLNEKRGNGPRRASSFKLHLFKIPYKQSWDEGVGYDYADFTESFEDDKAFSNRPSNWDAATTTSNWFVPGIYSNVTGSTVIATQSFDNGNENIAFDVTNEVNDILSAGTSTSGYGIAFTSDVENLSGLTESYSVAFYTKYTQTFFEPFLESSYDDLITDDRAFFYEGKANNLYLYSNVGGVPTNLDNIPTAQLFNNAGTLVVDGNGVPQTVTSKQITTGVYCATFTVPCDTYTTPCLFNDRWYPISVNDVANCITVSNEVTLLPSEDYYNIGINEELPKHYGYSFSGLKRNEKIASGNIRKIIVSARKQYTSNNPIALDNLYYRIYVKQGTVEIETQTWTKVNRAYNQNYFIVDTGNMVPNEYFVDLKAISNLETNIYADTISFLVVSQANYFGNPPA
tara:strand:+ start:7745 stop:9265 length:1521 start_codon:yes stop_codon:yes gene_type:complete